MYKLYNMKTPLLLLFSLGLLMTFQRCVTPNKFADNYVNGYWIQYDSITGNNFSSTDIANAKFVAAVNYVSTSNPSKVELYVISPSKREVLVKNLVWGTKTIEITALEVAKALTGTNATAQNFVDSFPPGGAVRFVYYPYDANGKKIITQDGDDLGSVAVYKNLNNNFSVNVVCPFVVDDLVGTYKVLEDGWGDVAVGDELTVSKISDTVYRIAGYPAATDKLGAHGAATTIHIRDVPTGTSWVKPYLDYGAYSPTGEVYSIEGGTGVTFSCVGEISLSIEFTDQGSFKLRLKKK